MAPSGPRIAVSLLAADFSALGTAVSDADRAGADWFHLDVMDGHFVPNLSFGPPVIRAIRPFTQRPFDVHLMVERPEVLIPDSIHAGAEYVTVHAETCPNLHRTLSWIRDLGGRPGVALNPATPLSALEEVLLLVDLVLIMSVNPGFGGQSFIPGSLDRIERCRAMMNRARSQAELSVDGGIGPDNAGRAIQAGATVLVAGSAIFGSPDGAAAGIRALRAAAATGEARHAR